MASGIHHCNVVSNAQADGFRFSRRQHPLGVCEGETGVLLRHVALDSEVREQLRTAVAATQLCICMTESLYAMDRSASAGAASDESPIHPVSRLNERGKRQ